MAKISRLVEYGDIRIRTDRDSSFAVQAEYPCDIGGEDGQNFFEGLSTFDELLDGFQQCDRISDFHMDQSSVRVEIRQTAGAI